ncbi:hypothetical protein GE061_011763 [Apolygus lucorum]|uniref:Uncharacterized protein n=1 Tax=Apolygus lucorum TaxID=248454 RepID=A0A6A4JSI9_APOLU|nr:hypothetical protein GE061_011763 [Apolygus lucorum]
MDKIRNSISSFSVRTHPRSNKHCQNMECLEREAHKGLSSSPFMPICDVDLMAFYVQRKIGSHSKQAPEDILQLIEQLTNVEEKVKAMEEKLGGGGVRHRHLNVMSVKENNSDRHSADQRRKKLSRKRRKGARCLCFPWSYRRDKSDKEDKKKTSKSEAKSHGKKEVTETLKHVGRGSRVSWDDGITVRYIGDESSAEELVKKISKKSKVARHKAYNDEESLDESPTEDDVKNVVHVKIRIPKNKDQSNSNIIEITGQNIEEDEDSFDVVKTQKHASPLKGLIEEQSAEYSQQPYVTLNTSEETSRTVKKRYEPSSERNQILGKTQENNKTPEDDHQSDVVNVVNSVEMGDSLKPLGSSEVSNKVEPEMIVERNIILSVTKTSDHNIDLDPKNISKKKLSKLEITADTKKSHSRRSSTTNKENLTTEGQEEFEYAEENVNTNNTSPIAMLEHPQKISEPEIVGIPIKESGRRSCGSQGCRCKGSSRNDSNLSDLKKSLNMNESETSLLDKMVTASAVPEEINVPTGSGVVNVVTHPYDCVCIVCETFGSRQESSRRNSVRSDTGTLISKRVIRVRYNEDYRHVLTHTEECGCAICVGIDEEMRKYKPRRSTIMSTRDSVLFVKNKGLCGCTDCKTVTTFKRDSVEMEQYNRDMEQQIRDYEAEISLSVPESMASRTSYRTIDPCYYSQATVPSINSFPIKRYVSYEDPPCPSIDSLESSDEEIFQLKNNRQYKEIIVNPKTKRVSLKKDDRDTNKAIIIISAKPVGEPEGLKEPHFTEKTHRKKRRQGFANRSPEGGYVRATEWPYKHSNKQDTTKGTCKSQKSKNKRIKGWRDRSDDGERERVDDTYDFKWQQDDSRSRKSRKVFKRTNRSEPKPMKHPKNDRLVAQANVETKDPQTTLEEIIKDLVSGRSDESEDKTYTITLGRIHDKPYTKVRIIDCSKPHIESSSSLFSTDTLQCPSAGRDGSDSTVFFAKPIPSISVSPTCSSNFARSGETSVVNISHSLVTNNHCQVSDSVPRTCSKSISPSPSLLIIPSVPTNDMGNEDRKSEDGETKSQPSLTKIVPTPTTVSTLTQEISNQKTRQRPKKSKFKIKLGGKVCSFFKRNERKKMIPVTTINNEIK